MDAERRARALLDSAAKQVPPVGEAMRRALSERNIEEFDPSFMWEAFAGQTSTAVRESNAELAQEHLRFVSQAVNPNDNYLFELIDVFYVEPLFVGLSAEQRRTGEGLLPLNLRLMYSRVHGNREA